MVADSCPDVSSSTRAEFSGVMVADSVFSGSSAKPKTVYIVGAFSTGVETVMGAFRYYNKNDYVFKPESRWFVHTTVSCHVVFPILS